MKVVNVVALASFKHRLDLHGIYRLLPRSVFYRFEDSNKLKRITWKFKNATIMFFESGYAICLGAKGSKQAVQLLKKAVNILSVNGFVFKLDKLKINVVNLIACENLNFNINLEELALKLSKCIYEPELFPALIYRDEDNAATFLIFSNGKITVAGVKDEDNAKKSIEKLKNFIEGETNERETYSIS